MPTSPRPLITQRALLARLADDNHQQIRRLVHDLEQVTRRNALLVEQVGLTLEMAAR